MLPNLIRAFARSFATAYPKPLWLVFSVTAVVLLAPIIWFFGFPTRPPVQTDALYFLLGSLPATLGTVFVLAFTFTFVAAQIASNYNQLLFNRMLGAWALWYAAPFAVGILLPLFLLNGHFFLWAVQISLLLGAFCIMSLLPFAVAVRALLSISDAIREKKDQILAATTVCESQRWVADLGHISVGALALRDFGTFEIGVRRLVESGKASDKMSVRLQICEEIRKMILRNVEERFASEVLMKAMVEVGLEEMSNVTPCAKEEMLDQVIDAYRSVNVQTLWRQDDEISLIRTLANLAVERGQPSIVRKCQTLLHVIGERAMAEFSVGSESANSAIVSLGDMIENQMTSASLPENQRGQLVISAVTRIEDLGTKAKELNRTELSDLALIQLKRAYDRHSNDHSGTRRHVEAAMAVLTAS